MPLVEDWRRIETALPDGWGDAQLSLTIGRDAHRSRAAALLAPLAPGGVGDSFRFSCVRHGAGARPDAVRRALGRLDEEHIHGDLELLSSGAAEPVAATVRPTLAGGWDDELDTLPADWSDVHAELELTSTDHLERAALLLSPVNPGRFGPRPAFRFRVARVAGYGASPELVRRCLERLDEEPIRGRVEIIRSLSDTRHAQTQGPVWYVGGKAV